MSPWGRLFRAVYLGFALVIFVGIASFLVAPRAGVFLLLAGVIGGAGMRLAFGVVNYRRTMRRPWPSVPPIDDEDEW